MNVLGDGRTPDSRSSVERAVQLTRAVARGGARLVQLRAKDLPAGPFTELAARLVSEPGTSRCRLIVNDRVDVALAAGAAGVHLGDEDLDPRRAREILGRDALIGYSTHSPPEAEAASALPVDYLGFGPVFESPTKAGVRSARGLDQLAAACSSTHLPVVAIGGVTRLTAPPAIAAGATSVAVIRELEDADDPEALARLYGKL